LGSEIKELDQQVDLLTMQVTFQINFWIFITVSRRRLIL
jgi:hypothetical protein